MLVNSPSTVNLLFWRFGVLMVVFIISTTLTLFFIAKILRRNQGLGTARKIGIYFLSFPVLLLLWNIWGVVSDVPLRIIGSLIIMFLGMRLLGNFTIEKSILFAIFYTAMLGITSVAVYALLFALTISGVLF